MSQPELLLILAGQSNMDGRAPVADLDDSTLPDSVRLWDHDQQAWTDRLLTGRDTFGPEYSAAQTLAEALPGVRIGLVKHAVGGTSLAAWAPHWSPALAETTNNAAVGPLFDQLLERIDAARATCPAAPVAGILWMQGEREARYADAAATYSERFAELIATLRQRVSAPDAPVVLGRVNPEPGPGRPAVAAVRDAQMAAAASPTVAWVDCDDMSKLDDRLHYDGPGIIALGQRLAQRWLSMRQPIALPQAPRGAAHGKPVRVQLRLGGLGDERHVLLIGNSLTHFHTMPYMLETLLGAATGANWVCSSVTRGGATLAWHRAHGYAERVLATAGPGAFDAVVVQDQSRRPAQHPAASAADFAFFFDYAARMQARPIGYLSWNLRDEPTHVHQMRATLDAAAAASGATVAPAGEHWEAVGSALPHLERYEPDGKHPTAIGSLIAAASLCQAIAGVCPTALPPKIAAGGYQDLAIDPADAAQILAVCGQAAAG